MNLSFVSDILDVRMFKEKAFSKHIENFFPFEVLQFVKEVFSCQASR